MKKQPPAITRSMAEKVIKFHLGKKPDRLSQVHGGLVNFVFDLEVGGEDFILRIADRPAKLQVYMKEQWVVTEVQKKGVPAPEILEVGNEAIPVPYMISRKAVGQPAATHPARMEILSEMGRLATIVHSVRTTDYGHIFDWSKNRLSRRRSWKEFLEHELKAWHRVRCFAQHKIFDPGNLRKLNKAVSKLQSRKGKPALNHGDLRLKNVLVNEHGKISALIDWEDSISTMAPLWDFSIALHDLNLDEKEAFLGGYEIEPSEFEMLSRDIKVVNILNYWPVVALALKGRQHDSVERLRQRLNGALDLFSL